MPIEFEGRKAAVQEPCGPSTCGEGRFGHEVRIGLSAEEEAKLTPRGQREAVADQEAFDKVLDQGYRVRARKAKDSQLLSVTLLTPTGDVVEGLSGDYPSTGTAFSILASVLHEEGVSGKVNFAGVKEAETHSPIDHLLLDGWRMELTRDRGKYRIEREKDLYHASKMVDGKKVRYRRVSECSFLSEDLDKALAGCAAKEAASQNILVILPYPATGYHGGGYLLVLVGADTWCRGRRHGMYEAEDGRFRQRRG